MYLHEYVDTKSSNIENSVIAPTCLCTHRQLYIEKRTKFADKSRYYRKIEKKKISQKVPSVGTFRKYLSTAPSLGITFKKPQRKWIKLIDQTRATRLHLESSMGLERQI